MLGFSDKGFKADIIKKMCQREVTKSLKETKMQNLRKVTGQCECGHSLSGRGYSTAVWVAWARPGGDMFGSPPKCTVPFLAGPRVAVGIPQVGASLVLPRA